MSKLSYNLLALLILLTYSSFAQLSFELDDKISQYSLQGILEQNKIKAYGHKMYKINGLDTIATHHETMYYFDAKFNLKTIRELGSGGSYDTLKYDNGYLISKTHVWTDEKTITNYEYENDRLIKLIKKKVSNGKTFIKNHLYSYDEGQLKSIVSKETKEEWKYSFPQDSVIEYYENKGWNISGTAKWTIDRGKPIIFIVGLNSDSVNVMKKFEYSDDYLVTTIDSENFLINFHYYKNKLINYEEITHKKSKVKSIRLYWYEYFEQ